MFQNVSLGNIGNRSICEYVNVSIHSMMDMRDIALEYHQNPTSIVFSVGFILFSLFTLFFGGRLFRPVAAIGVGLFGFFAVYQISENSERLSCDARVIISSVFGLVLGVMTGCLIKIALFLIGAGSVAALIHLFFAAFPELHASDEVPQILEKSVIYWGVIILGAIMGGFLLKWNQEVSLEAMTSIIGGAAFAYGLHGLTEVLGAVVNHWVFFMIGAASSLIGIIVQRKLRIRRKSKKESKKKGKKTLDIERG